MEDGENHDINRDADPSPTEAAATDNSNGDYHRRTSKVDPQETGGFRRQGNPRFTRMVLVISSFDFPSVLLSVIMGSMFLLFISGLQCANIRSSAQSSSKRGGPEPG